MPIRQKVFRIEMTSAAARAGADGSHASETEPHEQLLAELQALRRLIDERGGDGAPEATPPSRQRIAAGDLDKLRQETDVIHDAIRRTMRELASLHFGTFADGAAGRASRELDAVVLSTERATQQILDAAEGIDEAANTLSAALRREQELALTSDIREHVVRIFEACNFQDLSGQRIAKVLATLRFVEDRVTRMLEVWGGVAGFDDCAPAPGPDRTLVNGPRLDGDGGHATQQEIDAMFA